MSKQPGSGLSRRGLFTALGSAAAAGFLLSKWTPGVEAAEAEGPGVVIPTRRMGRTNLQVGVITGNETMNEPAVAEAAMEAGVNYWHKGGPGLMPVIKKFGREKQYVEICIDATGSVDKDMERFKSHLRNGLEYGDFYKMHGAYNEKSLEAFQKLKEEGLVKYLAASCHDYKDAMRAIETGNVDQVQIGASPLAGKDALDVMAAAKKADVGVVLMKTMMGGEKAWDNGDLKTRIGPYVEKGLSTPQAIVAACLAIDGVTALTIVTGSLERLQTFAEAAVKSAGQPAATAPVAAGVSEFCLVCGACRGVCPKGVAVQELMRADMYLRGYGEKLRARELYASIEPARRSASCENCGACAAVCAHKVASPERVAAAAGLLA